MVRTKYINVIFLALLLLSACDNSPTQHYLYTKYPGPCSRLKSQGELGIVEIVNYNYDEKGRVINEFFRMPFADYHSNSYAAEYVYKYSGANLVKKERFALKDNGEPKKLIDYYMYKYNDDNQILEENFINAYWVSEEHLAEQKRFYYENGLLIRMEHDVGEPLTVTKHYFYNENERLIKQEIYHGKYLMFTMIYYYKENGYIDKIESLIGTETRKKTIL